MTVPILAVTSGEPAGIGPDICLDLPEADLPCRCVVLGDKTLLQARAQALGKSVQLQDYDAARAPAAGVLEVLHIPLRAPCEAGRLSTENAPYVLQLLDRAYEGVQAGEFAALVTAPLHKGILNDAGIAFTGHTEYLAEKSGTGQVVMMLAGGMNIHGPYPADTLFQPFMLQGADAVLAMYHDQGLPVLKYASFGKGVNITLGLPFVRTSVDHGTALTLAGSGKADSGSLIVAVDTALAMAQHHRA